MNTRRALLSVSDKTGITDFARQLHGAGWELVSTGGTLKVLEEAGLPVRAVSDLTGFPEMLDGRVKTLHPAIHGGVLARRESGHLAQLAEHGIGTIDLVCVNLYPFRETVARGAPDAEVIENIDIGGPAMIRSAAKNHESVLILVDPADYPLALQAEVSRTDRRRLAAKAYAHTSAYDAAITAYLGGGEQEQGQPEPADAALPAHLSLDLHRAHEVRYGENPHQAGAIYRWGEQRGPVLDAQVVAGKPMSFNNYADADAAWALCAELAASHSGQVACVAVKHANPCGVALGGSVAEAWTQARDADTLSVFGGVVAVSGPVDLEAARSFHGTFLEVLIAPAVSAEAVEWFAAKKPDLRVLVAASAEAGRLDVRPLSGGFAVQERDLRRWDDLCPEVVTAAQPSESQWADLRFAWEVAKYARSNAVVLARAGITVGIGAGAVSRIWAAERAAANAGEAAQGAVMASEAFFPFDDVVRLAGQAGVSAIVQPGGAKRDPEVIAAADELGISMVLTGSRHFRH